MDQELIQLKKDVAELLQWKKDRMEQQLTAPFDKKSFDVLNKYFMSITKKFTYYGGAGGNIFNFYIGKQDTNLFQIEEVQLSIYTASPSTDYLTIVYGNMKYQTGDKVILYTDGTAPSPLSAGLGTPFYYIINSDGHTFQLSTTLGGSAINITDAGSGTQFITFY